MQRQRCEMVWGVWVEGVDIDLRVHIFDSRGQIPSKAGRAWGDGVMLMGLVWSGLV